MADPHELHPSGINSAESRVQAPLPLQEIERPYMIEVGIFADTDAVIIDDKVALAWKSNRRPAKKSGRRLVVALPGDEGITVEKDGKPTKHIAWTNGQPPDVASYNYQLSQAVTSIYAGSGYQIFFNPTHTTDGYRLLMRIKSPNPVTCEHVKVNGTAGELRDILAYRNGGVTPYSPE